MKNDTKTQAKAFEIAHAMPATLEAFTRHEMNKIAANIIAGAQDGETDPAKLYIKLDFIIKSLSKAKENIRDEALDELEKYEKGQQVLGVEIQIKNSVKYDYSHNEAWTETKADLVKIESDMKAAYKADMSLVNESTGETTPPARIKSASTSITAIYAKD